MLNFLVNAISRAIGFSKTESKGVLVLIFILLTSTIISKFYVKSIKNPTISDTNEKAELEKWVAELESSFELKGDSDRFDKIAYLPKPKSFKRENKAILKESNSGVVAVDSKSVAENDLVIQSDLNTASALDLQKVKGIGPAFSNRIVKFRDKLGGFSGDRQLEEVYGLPLETIPEIKKYFTVLSRPVPVDINADSAKVLARHPYISFDLAWIIINYRKQNGDIHSIEDLEKIKALDEKTIQKLRPYLN